MQPDGSGLSQAIIQEVMIYLIAHRWDNGEAAVAASSGAGIGITRTH